MGASRWAVRIDILNRSRHEESFAPGHALHHIDWAETHHEENRE
jgi:hypothetical protein